MLEEIKEEKTKATEEKKPDNAPQTQGELINDQQKPAEDDQQTPNQQKDESNKQGDKEESKKAGEAKSKNSKIEKDDIRIKKRSVLSNFGLGQERDYFMENLSMLLASGMNIISALDAVKGGVRSKVMKQIIDQLKVEIDDGSPIWKALDNTSLISNHSVALIKIGEESGRLPANIKVISIQTQKERLFRSKLFSALLYPVAVLCLTFVIGVGIAWFILPKLSTVFASMRLKLPITTKLLISMGTFLGKNGLIVIPSFIVLILILSYFLFVFKKTKFIGQKIIFVIPGVKGLIQQIELSKFGYTLGNLLDAGMPLVDALDSLREISSFLEYQKFYVFLRNMVEEGNSFQKCFEMYENTEKLVPFPIQQMIVTSEQSGSLKESLLSIGEIFEEKTDISTKNLAVILEPILLVVIWLVVAFVALSVMMPIYSLVGSFSAGS